MSQVPAARQAVDGPSGVVAPWYAWFRRIQSQVDAGATSADSAARAADALARALGSPDGTPERITVATTQVIGTQSVQSLGTGALVHLSLVNDQHAPAATAYYGTDAAGGRGYYPISSALLPGAGVSLAIGVDGRTTFSLPDVADVGGGVLQKTAFDAKGRKTGTSSASTSDLSEGSNLYYTDARADARVSSGIAALKAEADPFPGYTTATEVQAVADAKVQDAIADAVTDKAPSQNAVSDALALKYDKTGGAVSGPVLASGLCASGANTAGATGPNMLMIVSGGIGYLQGYNFSTGLKIPFSISGSVIYVEATAEAQPDNSRDWGTASFRFANVYAKNLRPGDGTCIWTTGVGSPEGVIAAAVGSLYTRTDGGAGTTLYVKETGASNTGWVGK